MIDKDLMGPLPFDVDARPIASFHSGEILEALAESPWLGVKTKGSS